MELNSSKNDACGSITDDFNNDGDLDIVTSSWDLGESMQFFKTMNTARLPMYPPNPG